MAWTTIVWNTGEVIDETRMNGMVGLSDYVREESNYYPVVTAFLTCDLEGMNAGSAVPRCSLLINDVAVFSDTQTLNFVEADIELASYGASSTGIHKITLVLSGYNSDAGFSPTWDDSGTADFYFYKTPDMNYLSCFVEQDVARNGTSSIGLANAGISIIGHRETKSWTV